MITPHEMVHGINAVFGRHPRSRALHAKGVWCRGTFVATPEAARLTRAPHMQGAPMDVTVRFSHGSGDPGVPDYADGVRGMAVTFHLPDGGRTDILGQTARRFPVRTPEEFIALVRAAGGGGIPYKLALFLARHPSAIPALRQNLPLAGPPASYATRSYYPVHAFRWVNGDGVGQFVRYTFVPEAGEEGLSRADARRRGRDYLRDELVERLAQAPVRFALELRLAQAGDDVDNPMSIWPDDRAQVTAGTLEITELIDDPEAHGEVLVFDPVRVPDGIELSQDPILRYRPDAYSVSVERRAGS